MTLQNGISFYYKLSVSNYKSCHFFSSSFSPAIISMHQMLEYDNNNRLSDSKVSN